MDLDKLKTIDPTLKIYKNNSFSGKIIGITIPEYLKNHHIVFIKDRKYLLKLLDQLTNHQVRELVLVLGVDLISVIEQDEYRSYHQYFSLITTAADIGYSMCVVSKHFYDEALGHMDNVTDGREYSQIDSSSKIASNVFIGSNVVIKKNVVIHSGCNILSNSTLGEGTILFPNVTIYSNVVIGRNCRIHSGSVIGADGFGYHFYQGVHQKIWHYGGVIIDDEVEIGSCSTVDSGTFIPTRIGSGTKIDNLVQIAHNCNVKRGVIFCGQSALSGSCSVGNFAVFGGKAGMGPDTTIGDGCQVAGGALVSKNWPDGTKLAGHPARELGDWLKSNAFIQNNIRKKKR